MLPPRYVLELTRTKRLDNTISPLSILHNIELSKEIVTTSSLVFSIFMIIDNEASMYCLKRLHYPNQLLNGV